jgi:hypothetical protein
MTISICVFFLLGALVGVSFAIWDLISIAKKETKKYE